MAKATRGEQTRTNILHTAGRLFSMQGYFSTSMVDILETVSVSKGAFYYHYKSKQELGLAVLVQLRDDYERDLIVPVRGYEPGRRLREGLSRIVELNGSGQWYNCLLLARLAQEMAGEESELSEQVAETANWLVSFWQEITYDAQSAGAIRKDLDSRAIAEMILALFFGAVSCHELQEQIAHLPKITEQLQLLIFV